MARIRKPSPRAAAVALPAALLLVAGGGPAAARSSLVYGGLTSAGYLYTGEQSDNIFHQGAANDAHFRAGGLLGTEYARSWFDARAGLFAGALVAAVAEGFRLPVAALDSAAQWRASRRLTLSASLTGSVEPVTSSRLRSTSVTTTVGKPALLYNPSLEAEVRLGARDLASMSVRANELYLLSKHDDVHGEDLAASTGVEGELFFAHTLHGEASLEAMVVGRVMGAKARTNPPITGLVGGLAGFNYEVHRLRFHAAGGVVAVVGLPNSHLWPVEPAFDAELAFTPTQLERLAVGASWLTRENAYVGGLPSRFINARLGWSQIPSYRRLRTAAELGYELNKYGSSRVLPRGRDADTLHTVRGRGRLYYQIIGGFRLFTEIEAAVGFVSLAEPGACAPLRCADQGFMFRGLAGLAYVVSERPRDERLLSEVW